MKKIPHHGEISLGGGIQGPLLAVLLHIEKLTSILQMSSSQKCKTL